MQCALHISILEDLNRTAHASKIYVRLAYCSNDFRATYNRLILACGLQLIEHV